MVWNDYQMFVMVIRGLIWLLQVWNGFQVCYGYQRFGMVTTGLEWLPEVWYGLE